MSLINNVIIHKLIKEQHGDATFALRDTELSLTEPVKKLVWDIQELYSGRTSKGYGRFDEGNINYLTPGILRCYFEDKNKNFFEISCDLMSVLADKANPVGFATGGFVLMAHISGENQEDWFVVAIIKNTKGTAIDENTYEVNAAIHVDLDDLRVAGRINVADWLSGAENIRYIGFLKQRDKISDYFKEFLGCSELIVNTEETKKLVSTLKDFAKSKELGKH